MEFDSRGRVVPTADEAAGLLADQVAARKKDAEREKRHKDFRAFWDRAVEEGKAKLKAEALAGDARAVYLLHVAGVRVEEVDPR